MADPPRAPELERLRAMGVRFRSTTSAPTIRVFAGRLKNLLVDELKKSIGSIRPGDGSEPPRGPIVRASIEPGRRSDLRVVGRGVEYRATLGVLAGPRLLSVAQGTSSVEPIAAARASKRGCPGRSVVLRCGALERESKSRCGPSESRDERGFDKLKKNSSRLRSHETRKSRGATDRLAGHLDLGFGQSSPCADRFRVEERSSAGL